MSSVCGKLMGVVLSLSLAMTVVSTLPTLAFAEESEPGVDDVIVGEGGYASAGHESVVSRNFGSTILRASSSDYNNEWFWTYSAGCCSGEGAYCGIDVSYWNGKLDWSAIKESGIGYAIIRVGYIGNDEHMIDSRFVENVQACIENGIPFGVYVYSYVKSAERAKSGAEFVVDAIEQMGLSSDDLGYPIYLDLEDSSTLGSDFAAIAQAFCGVVEDAGYAPGIYANTNWFANYLADSCFGDWHKWIAQYNKTIGLTYPEMSNDSFRSDGAMWQFSSGGVVEGANGVSFDLNYTYLAPLNGQTLGASTDVSQGAVRLRETSFSYKAAPWTVDLAVLLDGRRLEESVDFTSLYSNNEEVGTAGLELKGCGACSGSANATFDIVHLATVDSFSDFSPDAWYLNESSGSFFGCRTLFLDYVFAREIMIGVPGGAFEPDSCLTRAQAAAILYRTAGSPVGNHSEAFADVDEGDWYYDAVAWAANEGVVYGMSATSFCPDDTVTREQLAAMVYRYCMISGAEDVRVSVRGFADYETISSYAVDALSFCCANGIILGVSDTELAPKNPATRVQMAVIAGRTAQGVLKL